MSNMETVLRYVFFIIIMIASTITQAGTPLWTFQPLTATTLTVPANGTATVQYQVTNHSSKLINLLMQPIAGITASGCTPVASHQSCTLTLQINGATIPASISGGPILCNQLNPLQCYRPTSNSELRITRSNQPPLSTINITGSPLLLTPNSTGFLTIINNSSQTVTNIHAILPAGLAANVTQDASNCVTVLPGQSCHLQFTANNQVYPATTIIIVGDNTVTQEATVAIDYSSITDGDVLSVAYNNTSSLIYIGGAFSYVGPNQGGGALLNTSTGLRSASFPRVKGYVYTWVDDGSGGWYIGGFFSEVGTVARNNIAHVLSDNTVDASWNPNADNAVFAMVKNGSTLYVGGGFNNIGGQNRNLVAALDVATGLATIWNAGIVPNPVDSVMSITLDNTGSTVYIGGEFTSVGGQGRNRVAALDATTGAVNGWNPNANIQLSGILFNGTNVYAWGSFTSIGGQARNQIAELDATTGLATAWNPNANQQVISLALNPNGLTVFVGGRFSNIGGQLRRNIAELSVATGLATAWNPFADNDVRSLAVSGTTVYAGGDFRNIGGQERLRIAALDATSGAATSWNPIAGGSVRFLSVSGSTVAAGGIFVSVNGQIRDAIASLNASTGQVTTWNPDVKLGSDPGNVNALALSGSTIYIGGDFDTVGVATRNNIAALDTSTGLATSWDPNADSTVEALAVSAGIVYAGGGFNNIGGQGRNNIAALDMSTGLATSWNPNANNDVRSLALLNSTVYAGGRFTNIGGQARNRIAALDASSGLATTWNPNASSPVNTLAFSSDGLIVYVGGEIFTIGGQARSFIAALNTSDGQATAWDPSADNVVRTIVVSGSTVYVGGDFNNIGGQTRNSVAALNGVTGLATNWNPNADSRVNALALSGSNVYIGGSFFIIDDVLSPNFSITVMDMTP